MIGIDLDNTIISYNAAFLAAARKLGFDSMGEVPETKHGIRQWLQSADRNDLWTELQGYVYGPGLEHATPFPGVLDCLGAWWRTALDFCVVSHKTAFPSLGPQYNLREAAMKWLHAQGFFDPHGAGLDRGRVFFSDDRSQKVAQIISTKCRHFIDDLPEVFDEPGFPVATKQCLFDPDDVHAAWPGETRCRDWREIQQWMQSFS